VLLFDINNTNVRAFVKTLQARIRKTVDVDQDVLPFEFRVLEVLLMTVCDGLYEQLKSLKPELSATMSNLSKRVQQGELELLLQQNHLLRGIESNAIDVRDAIQSFLHSDEDMANAYLTVKAKYGTSRRVDQHHEIELLLENYLKEIVELVDEVQKEREGIKFAQMLINISLDSKRNRIMTTNLLLSLATFSSSICAVSAGYFGMNLHSGMETHPNAFLFISGASALVSATVYLSAVAWWKRRNIL
jgi:magnesium transporter